MELVVLLVHSFFEFAVLHYKLTPQNIPFKGFVQRIGIVCTRLGQVRFRKLTQIHNTHQLKSQIHKDMGRVGMYLALNSPQPAMAANHSSGLRSPF